MHFWESHGISSLLLERRVIHQRDSAFEDAPCLQLALDCFKITLEEDVIHNPTIEETLRDNP